MSVLRDKYTGRAKRCDETGLTKPECSCPSCTRELIKARGSQAAARWLSSADDQPLTERTPPDDPRH